MSHPHEYERKQLEFAKRREEDRQLMQDLAARIAEEERGGTGTNSKSKGPLYSLYAQREDREAVGGEEEGACLPEIGARGGRERTEEAMNLLRVLCVEVVYSALDSHNSQSSTLAGLPVRNT